MSAAERIAAAIARLEQLKAASTPGPWWVFDPDPTAIYGTGEFGTEPHVGDTAEQADRDLIVTLHRTIDAQLAILHDEQRRVRNTRRYPTWEPWPVIGRTTQSDEEAKFDISGEWYYERREPQRPFMAIPRTVTVTETELLELEPTLTLWYPIEPAANIVALADAIVGES